MQPITIYLGRQKAFILLLLSVVLGALSYYFENSKCVVDVRLVVSPILLYAIPIFFGLIAAYEIFILLFKKSAFIISNEGVEDRSSCINFGLIPWAEIDRIFYRRIAEKDYICVALKKPTEFFKKQFFIKRLFSGKKARENAFVVIPQELLPVKPWDLIKEIRDSHPEVRIHYPYTNLEAVISKPSTENENLK